MMSRHVTLLVALTIALGSCPAVNAGEPMSSLKSGSKLSGHIRYSRISPPESGVKLLEDIFIRVRSAPQVAMKQNNLKYQSNEVLAQAQGPTDNSLLIRPTQKGKTVGAQTPSLQIVQRVGTGINAYNPASTTRASASEPDNWMGSLYTPTGTVQAQQGGKGYFWQAQNDSEQEKIKVGMLPPPAAAPYTNSHAAFRDYNDSTPEQKNRPVPDLGTAVNKLAHLNKRLEQLQRPNQPAADKDLREAQARPAEEVSFKKKERAQSATNYGGIPKASLESGYGDNQYSRELKVPSQRRLRADQVAMVGGQAAANMGGGFGAAGAPDDVLDAIDEKTEVAKLALNNNPNVIALLPPNVVTGIPLIRLGISERQANAALQEIGSMTQLKVSHWTVWSWAKPQARSTATALQLYMRNGLLDAMRIFDRTLIAPDFGVSLGDSLAMVKEKFGEPAFILTEPTPGAGQNYIYPISQVGFQLARPSPNEPPRVVSVLIFNVK